MVTALLQGCGNFKQSITVKSFIIWHARDLVSGIPFTECNFHTQFSTAISCVHVQVTILMPT